MTAQRAPLPEFRKVGDVPPGSIERFRDVVPDEVVEIWEAGTGFVGDGFLRVVDPAQFTWALQDGLMSSEDAVPIFVSAFGDVVFWGPVLVAAVFSHGKTQGLAYRLDLLPRLVADPTFATAGLSASVWPAARESHGVPEFDECFTFVPLLALGGPERVENLRRVRVQEPAP